MSANRAFATAMAVVAFWTASANGSANEMESRGDPLQRFHEAVSAYMSLRAATEQIAPPPETSADWENIRIAVDAMADAIRVARPSAKEGDIFAEAAPLFRRRIRETLREPDCQPADILAAQGDDDERPAQSRPIVHDRFDWGAGSFMAFCILEVLPELPEALQFRFVERDLVLVDIDADLVIDVLPDALPPGEFWTGIRYARLRSVPGQVELPWVFSERRGIFPDVSWISGDTRRIARQHFGTAVADAAAMTDSLHERVRGEYREMPGLRLTVAQAARLFNLDHARCGQLLDTLVTDGALCTNGREYFGINSGRRCT